MHERQRQADDDARDRLVFRLGGDAHDGEHEGEGEHDLRQKADDKARVAVGFGDDRLHGVAAQVRERAEQKADDGGPCQGADHLPGDIAEKVFQAQLFIDEHGLTDRGVDVAAGNVADRIRHRHDGKPEGEGGGDQAVAAFAAGGHGDAAAEHDQHHGADTFRQIFFE